MNSSEETSISRDSPLPLYYQIRQYIEQDLIAGKFDPGSKLSSENELAEQFSVSRMTVRRAIDQLVSQGFLERIQGRGTFVNELPDYQARPVGITRWSFERIMATSELHEVVQQVDEVSPSLRVANLLHTMPGESVIRFMRFLYRDEEPYGYGFDHIPETFGPDIEKFEPGNQSVWQFLMQECGLEFGKVVERVLATSAEDDAVEILRVEPGSPLLYVDSLIFLRLGIPAILSRVTYRPEYIYRGRLMPLIEDSHEPPGGNVSGREDGRRRR